MAMANARECAQLLLETLPNIYRGVGGAMRLRRALDQEPLTMEQVRLLRILSHEPRTLSELAAHKGVTPSTMSRSIDVLVRRGWVGRESDPSDRRLVIVQVTDAGQAAHNAMQRQIEDALTQRIDELSDGEREQLFAGIRVLHQLFSDGSSHDECRPDPDVLRGTLRRLRGA
jgi:DNA-binding MarR family transcriptional regulator